MKKFLSNLIVMAMFCLTTVGLADNSIITTFTDINGQPISNISSTGMFYIKITALYNNSALAFDAQTPLYSDQLPIGVTFTGAPLANCLSVIYHAGQSCLVQFTFAPTIHDGSTKTITVNARNAHVSPEPAYTSATITIQNN